MIIRVLVLTVAFLVAAYVQKSFAAECKPVAEVANAILASGTANFGAAPEVTSIVDNASIDAIVNAINDASLIDTSRIDIFIEPKATENFIVFSSGGCLIQVGVADTAALERMIISLGYGKT